MQILCLVVCSALLFPLFLLPFPRNAEGSAGEEFSCAWEDGSVSQERDFGSIRILGAEGEYILVQKGERRGKVLAGKEFLRALHAPDRGDAFEILSFRLKDECARIEKLALFYLFQDTCIYLGEALYFDGTSFVPAGQMKYQSVCFLEGTLPENFLKECGAKRLKICPRAEFSAKDLVESEIAFVEAEPPYRVEEGAVYLDSLGGTRLVAVLPGVEKLDLNCDYIDEGAMAPCGNLKELTLRREYDMTLSMMFGERPIPEGLKVYEEIF